MGVQEEAWRPGAGGESRSSSAWCWRAFSRSRSTEAPRQSRERLAGGEEGAVAGAELEVVVLAVAWVLMGGE